MSKNANRLQRLEALGQSVWLDYIPRGLIGSGGLPRPVSRDGGAEVPRHPPLF